ncbi:hxnY [Symbiodinium sp. CCMP2456]|nr:hxnY [Symbiodinium sp. CCMP2456]
MQVPTISLQSFFEAEADCSDLEELSSNLRVLDLASQLRAACEEVGFFVVTEHGVSKDLMEGFRQECTAFFRRSPQSNVLNMVCGADSRFVWLDYVPAETEKVVGGSKDGSFSLGPVQGRGSLPWQLDSKELSDTWAMYYAAMEDLVATLMKLFALAMQLPMDTFATALDEHRSSMRAILYPSVSEEDLQAAGGTVVRSPEHTDWGCVTVLLADPAVSGLEVCDKAGHWTLLRAAEGDLVVNLGELLQWWTGGTWLATPHRVVARPESSGDRLSCPYFGLVNRGTLLQPLIPDSAGANPTTPVTAGDFFQSHEKYTRPWQERWATLEPLPAKDMFGMQVLSAETFC